MSRIRVHLLASRVHKWLALIIGAQLLIWFASGVIMSFLPIDKVRGEHLVDRETVMSIPAGMRFADPAKITASVGASVKSINWHMMGDRAVAEVTTTSGIKLFDAQTAVLIPPVSADQATAIANAAWKSSSRPKSKASRVVAESPEYRAALPAWRIAYADPDATSIFVAADTGKITAVRTGTWRLYDFFWSLHIMDWKNHENFNTWWLLAFAVGGLVLGIAGTILLIIRWPFRRRRKAKRLAVS